MNFEDHSLYLRETGLMIFLFQMFNTLQSLLFSKGKNPHLQSCKNSFPLGK